VPATGAITVDISGDKAVIAMMESLPDRVFKNVVRREIRKTTKQVAADIGQSTPNPGVDETAHGRTRTYGQTVVGIAGYSLTKIRAKGYPSNIDYLLEYGHRIVVGGTTERTDNKKAQGSYIGDHATGKGRVVGFVQGTGAVRSVADRTGQQNATALSLAITAGAVKEAQAQLKRAYG